MNLKIDNEFEDVRGKIIFYSYNNKKVNVAEIKKGYARGGHYHKFDQDHFIISGKLEYREKNLKTGKEEIKIIDKPSIIHVPANSAHLLLALEDSLFFEVYDGKYEAANYPEYRKIVEEKLK